MQEMPVEGGFGCLELVLYGMRGPMEQFLESNIDIRLRRLAWCEVMMSELRAQDLNLKSSQCSPGRYLWRAVSTP